jgi:hypothetical protein
MKRLCLLNHSPPSRELLKRVKVHDPKFPCKELIQVEGIINICSALWLDKQYEVNIY